MSARSDLALRRPATRSRRGTPSRARRGFSLMEAMTVVAIIGMSAALAAPAIMEAVAVRRASEATHLLVRIGSRGRAEALAYGRAHLLIYSDASTGPGSNFGSVELWRGLVDRCSANDWTTIVTGSCETNDNCIDELDMGSLARPTHRVRMRLAGASDGAICFQPNGEMRFSTAGGVFGMAPPAGQDAIEFTFQRLNGNTPVGVQRRVVFPFGTTPRVAR